MASLVWRWNHPDNPKAQINTTGFPNDNLMKDLALFYIKREQYQNDLDKYRQKRAERIEQIRIAQEVRRREREERLRRQREAEAERQRIYNLPENVEARRIAEEQRQERQRIFREKQEADRLAREIAKRQKQEEVLTKDFGGETFLQMCDYYGVPEFDESFANNNWERGFLADIKEQMMSSKELSVNQLRSLKKIFDEDTATPKQLQFLNDLGYEGTVSTLTKRQASSIISQLLEERN
jgi:flagellar biosynthesis GTPase FlhF